MQEGSLRMLSPHVSCGAEVSRADFTTPDAYARNSLVQSCGLRKDSQLPLLKVSIVDLPGQSHSGAFAFPLSRQGTSQPGGLKSTARSVVSITT